MRVLLVLLLAIQALPPTGQKPGGSVTGRIRLSSGLPAVGMRVAAMLAPDGVGGPAGEKTTFLKMPAGGPDANKDAAQPNAADVGALFSQTQTDELGRYRLEDVPPGRYYIMAGRVDSPTFHPGTTDQVNATAISVASGTPIEGIDFTVRDTSAAVPLQDSVFTLMAAANIPVRFRMTAEGGSRLPLVSAGGRVKVKATAGPAQITGLIGGGFAGGGATVSTFVATGTTSTSTLFGTFVVRAGSGVTTLVMAGRDAESSIQPDGTTTLMISSTSYRFYVENLPQNYEVKSMVAGTLDLLNSNLSITNAGADVNVVVGLKKPPPPRSGRSITGRVTDGIIRKEWVAESVTLSGRPGTVFSDGSFEFLDVAPGRYLLEAQEGAPGGRTAQANITVGSSDVTANLIYAAAPMYVQVAGKIVMDDGTSVPANLYSARLVTTVSGHPASTAFLPDGTFKMILPQGGYDFSTSGLPPGLKIKSIVAEGMDLLAQSLQVQPKKGPIGPEVVVTLSAVPRVKFRGLVVSDPPGRSLDGAEVALTGGPEGHTTRVQPDGTFEFLPVLPGRYTLTIQPFGFTHITETIVVEDKDLLLEFKSRPM